MRLSRRMVARIFPFLLVLVTVAAYWPVMRAGYIWDDDDYLLNNPVYTTKNPLYVIWFLPSSVPVAYPIGSQYYPVVYSSFYIERLIYGLNPLGYHLVNVVLHAGSAILFWLILRRLRVPGAALAAALFAVHPLMVESVAWVTERKNTYSMLFMLASLLTFIKFTIPRPVEVVGRKDLPRGEGRGHWGWYFLSVLFFVLAILSKTVVCGLAPMLVMVLWWKGRRKSFYALTTPFFVIGLVAGLVTIHLEKTVVGAHGAAWQLLPVEKILLAGRIIWFYAGKLVYPGTLSFYYYRWPIEPGVWWQWLFPAGVVAVVAALWIFRRRIGKGPLVGVISFFALLFPAMGFFPVFPMQFSWVADHFAYHATVGLLAIGGAVLTVAAHRWLPGQVGLRVALAAALVCAFGWMSTVTAKNYENAETLWRSVIANDPARPHWNALSGLSNILAARANQLWEAGDKEGAAAAIEEARALDEKSLEMKPGYAVAYNNLAGYHAFKGEYEKALPLAQKAAELEPNDPRIHITLAHLYSKLEQYKKAAEESVLAVRMKPAVPTYHLEAAKALLDAGETERAATYLKNVLYLEPGNAGAHLLNGFMAAQQGDIEKAVGEFRYASAAEPGNVEAANNFAKAVSVYPKATVADLQEAEREVLRAIEQTRGTNFELVATYAIVLHRTGRNPEAVRVLREALTRVPADQAHARETMQRNLEIFERRQAPPQPPATTGAK